MSHQLEALRRQRRRTARAAPAGGIYLGAYGWLENVKSEFKELTPVELPDDLADDFSGADEPPLTRDSKNEGYIHAPSLNHAVTAALLRNGYLSNATPDNPQSLAVNLSSERVRVALSIIEGLQQAVRAFPRCSAIASSADCTTATMSRSMPSSMTFARPSRSSPTA